MNENEKKPGTYSCDLITFDEGDAKQYDVVVKSDTSEQLDLEEAYTAHDWVQKRYDQYGLKIIVNESTILPQCIAAYAANISGFGIGVKYKDEYNDGKETGEMEAEYKRVQNIIKMLGAEMDTKEIFARIVTNRETYGIGYMECIRNLNGDVVQIENIKDVPSVEMTKPTGDYVSFEATYGTEKVTRVKQFRKFKQTVAGKTVYFKEFGDERIMDKRTGEYTDSLELQYRANEILVFSVGEGDYGEVRWIGQVLTQDGARRAEQLNYNYFINGRHVPLLIALRGGSLTDESKRKLKTYLQGARGEKVQHGFLIIEVEADGNRTDFDQDKPDIQIEQLSSILQQDALFTNYQDDARRKMQSAFRLPDLYVGYTTDFNRATAQTAMEVTEKQVFQTERESIEWIINNKLLASYSFKYCEIHLKEPDISNPDDIHKLLQVANVAGGVTPNLAKEVACKALGKVSEDYDEEWGNVPLAYLRSTTSQLGTQVDTAIIKAQNEKADDIIPILKGVKSALIELTERMESEDVHRM